MDPLQFTPDPTLTDAIRKGIGVHLQKANGGGSSATARPVAWAEDTPYGTTYSFAEELADQFPGLLNPGTISAQGEAVGEVTFDPLVGVRFYEFVCFGVELPAGTKLYTHPAPRVEVDENRLISLPNNDAVPAPTRIEPGNLFLWNWAAMQEYARTCVEADRAALTAALNKKADDVIARWIDEVVNAQTPEAGRG